ncbi:MAG: glycosyltransferase family 4 protein [Opitutales bacterium]
MSSTIGVIAPEFPPDVGGMERFAASLVGSIAKAGVAVVVVTRSREMPDDYNESRVTVVTGLCGFEKADRELILRYDSGVIGWCVLNAAYTWVVQYVKPVILTIHGNDFLNPNPTYRDEKWSKLIRGFSDRLEFASAQFRTKRSIGEYVGSATAVTANSAKTLEMFSSRFGKLDCETLVSYCGVGDAFFEGLLKNGGVPISIITGGRLNECRKNFSGLIRAMRVLEDRDPGRFVLSVFGDGDARSVLENLVSELNLDNSVKFIGRPPNSELPLILREHQIFAMVPKREQKSFEGFGIVYLEALASGLAVVCGKHTGFAELASEKNHCVVAQGETEHDIAAAIVECDRILANSDRNTTRGFAEQFRWDRVAAKYLDLINRHFNRGRLDAEKL